LKGVAFSQIVATQRASYDGSAEVIVGSSKTARDEILRRVNTAKLPATDVLIGVFQGEQRTGGYAVQATSIERRGDELLVHAAFTEPAANGFVTQVITSPAHVVSVAATDLTGVKTAVLLDASGTERARASLPLNKTSTALTAT